MKKVGLILFAVLVVAFIVLAMLYQSGAIGTGVKVRPGEKAALTPPGKAARGWQTLAHAEIPVYYSAVGTVRSREEIDVISRLMTARVLHVPFDSGEAFAAGEVLVRLEDSDLQAKVNVARENLRAAESRLEFASTDFERNTRLLQSQTVTMRQYEESASVFNAAKAQVAMLRHELANAEINLGFATVKAPFAGVVSERQVDPGDLATPQNPLLKIFNPSKLQLRVPVRENLFSRIALGDRLQVSVESTGKVYDAEVREIIPAVDPGSRTFLLNACLEGQTEGLKPGMFATCDMAIGSRKALTVKATAITRVGQLEYLTVPGEAGQPVRRLVKTVPAPDSERREIVSGGHPGLRYLE